MTVVQQELNSDLGLKPVPSHIEEVEMDGVVEPELLPSEDKRLLRRIDCYLLPIMGLSYLFQFLDKAALGFTSIMGLPEDLNLKGQEYSWAGAIYYVGYLVASYPAGLLLVKWRVAKTITTAVAIWGTILMLTALCFNGEGLLTARFFLGLAEAPIAPALTVVVSMWYKRNEQPLRHAAWFLGTSIAGIVGGPLAYGISHIESIAPWKALLLIFGGATAAWSIGIFFLLPDTPMTAYFLSSEDREKAVVRVKENLTGIKNNEIKWSQVKEALLDPKTWLIIALQLASNIPNGGITTFSSLVVNGLGFSVFNTLLLSSVQYISQLILVIIGTFGSTHLTNCRTLFMLWNYSIAIAGIAMIRFLPAEMRWAKFAGTVMAGAFSANFPLLMSLMSGNFGGFSKKTTVNALSFIAYCAGNIVGPQLFFSWEKPTYNSGFFAVLVCMICAFLITLCIRLYLIWENHKRDASVSSEQVQEFMDAQAGVMVNLMDRTDKEIPQFRYVY